MHEPEFLLFASDATLFGIGGAVLVLLSVGAWLGERRRNQRTIIDSVGWMPWGTLSIAASFIGLLMLIMAAMGWLRG
ncbi:MAG TPA: hypothetical protein VNR60_13540 [Croceibacterium sp.]|nr:hypothetical protein [Croceibacterium sp.]